MLLNFLLLIIGFRGRLVFMVVTSVAKGSFGGNEREFCSFLCYSVYMYPALK